MHTVTFKHPIGQKGILAKIFNVGPHALGGAMSTVSPGVYYFNSPDKPYAVMAGPSMRTVIDYADFDATEMAITLGQSGNRFSPHYADQLYLWLEGRSIPFYGKDGGSAPNRGSRLVLSPAEH
jgi:penicillin amidase